MSSSEPRELVLTLPSTFESQERAVEEILQFLESHALPEDEVHRVTLTASEAVNNAMEHGNRMDETKQVGLQVTILGGRVVVNVQDEGEGFDRAAVKDPLEADRLLVGGGRGVFLMDEYTDAVKYEDGGRRVKLVFELRGAP